MAMSSSSSSKDLFIEKVINPYLPRSQNLGVITLQMPEDGGGLTRCKPHHDNRITPRTEVGEYQDMGGN